MRIQEFLEFLKRYGVVGLAIGVVVGGKLNDLVKALDENLVMPLIGIFLPSGKWEKMGFDIAGAHFGVGPFLSALLNFVIVAFLVFLFSKFVLREEVPPKA